MRMRMTMLIIIFLTLVSCGLNTKNTNNERNNTSEFGSFSFEGCIQIIENRKYLIDANGERWVLGLGYEKPDLTKLIVDKSYKLEVSTIFESNPPVILVERFQEINKNYCE